MGNSTTDLRFTSLLSAEVQSVLEKHGYRLPSDGEHVHELVLARVDVVLRNLVEIFEGRTR
ncbi:hypothetical protein ABZ897_28730 [Nonomuraea sp. NPDC046802]|uniref:hypothetical protein n=1 Tax=Nonomuraea sp. NPDC046802 TaxID=3154919 RepID=UPI003405F707